MRVKQSVRKYFSLLIVILFVFQLIPSTLTSIECFKSHAQNSKAILLSGTTHNDISFINRDGRKPSFHKITTKYNASLAQYLSSVVIPFTNSLYSEVLLDYRNGIEQAIPHYFHGGKYKNEHLTI